MASKRWHLQQEQILKKWGESSSCMRYLHYKSYQKLKKKSMNMTIPIIVISTITGTASFAHETFPESWRDYVPLVIGAFNIFGGMLTTIMQFMKVNELMEAHRVSSIQYGKLYRNIDLELSLPPLDRTHDGCGMLEICKTEYDRLVEQSPSVPGDILREFELKFPYPEFYKPEISDITKIQMFTSPPKPTIPQPSNNLPKSITIKRTEPEPVEEFQEVILDIPDLEDRKLVQKALADRDSNRNIYEKD